MSVPEPSDPELPPSITYESIESRGETPSLVSAGAREGEARVGRWGGFAVAAGGVVFSIAAGLTFSIVHDEQRTMNRADELLIVGMRLLRRGQRGRKSKLESVSTE